MRYYWAAVICRYEVDTHTHTILNGRRSVLLEYIVWLVVKLRIGGTICIKFNRNNLVKMKMSHKTNKVIKNATNIKDKVEIVFIRNDNDRVNSKLRKQIFHFF